MAIQEGKLAPTFPFPCCATRRTGDETIGSVWRKEDVRPGRYGGHPFDREDRSRRQDTEITAQRLPRRRNTRLKYSKRSNRHR
jgi:hypothetical protein